MVVARRRSISNKSLTQLSIVIVLVILSQPLIAAGQLAPPGATWAEWRTKGSILAGQGKYDEASQALRNALTAAIAVHAASQELAGIYESLAAVYANDGLFAKAETTLRSALQLERQIAGPERLPYALDLATICLLPTHTGSREDAIQALRVAIGHNNRTCTQVDLTIAQDDLVKLLYQDNRIEEAEEAFVDWQCIYQPEKVLHRSLMGELLSDRAVILDRLGRCEEAYNLEKEAIRLFEEQWGKDHPALVAPLTNLACISAHLDRFDDSERIFQRAATICQQKLGDHHPMYGAILSDYAVVLQKLGRKKESRKMRAQAEEIVRSSNRRNGIGDTISVSALQASNR